MGRNGDYGKISAICTNYSICFCNFAPENQRPVPRVTTVCGRQTAARSPSVRRQTAVSQNNELKRR